MSYLLTSLDNLLLVIGICNPLDSSQCLSSTSLLNPDVNEPVLDTLVVPLICIKKWVCKGFVRRIHYYMGCNTHRIWPSFGSQTCDFSGGDLSLMSGRDGWPSIGDQEDQDKSSEEEDDEVKEEPTDWSGISWSLIWEQVTYSKDTEYRLGSMNLAVNSV